MYILYVVHCDVNFLIEIDIEMIVSLINSVM